MATPTRDALAIHLKKATLKQIDAQAAELKGMYEIYRTMRGITRSPGDLKMNFEVRSEGRSELKGQGVTADQIKADAAKFRILQGIKAHVVRNIGDVQSFDLAFDLSCRQIPDLEDPIHDLPGGIAGGGMGGIG